MGHFFGCMTTCPPHPINPLDRMDGDVDGFNPSPRVVVIMIITDQTQ